jgi:hypothetical protein
MDLWEIGWLGVDRVHLAQDRENWLDIVKRPGSITGREFLN